MNKPWMKWVWFGLFVFVIVSLQCSHIFQIYQVLPDMLLVVFVLFAIYQSRFAAEITGFVVGLIVDTLTGGWFGFHAFLYTFLAWFVGIYQKRFFVTTLQGFLFFILWATFLKYLIFLLLSLIIKGQWLFSGGYLVSFFGEWLYNSVWSVLFFFFLPLLFFKEE